ncbi:MAG: hypothetical protein KME27_06755 [Lyngbya sp. HA4199-MV5]|jgi:hypothetical protein|nr:hypothetical protein [Lyngbya sp. HA4199-MV5]
MMRDSGMYKDKSVDDRQIGKLDPFWRIWRVRFPLGLLAANLLFCLWLIDHNPAAEGGAFVDLVSSWKFWKLFGMIAAVIGLTIGTIATIAKRSVKKGALVGLEFFLDALIGTFTGATTGSLIVNLQTSEHTNSEFMFVLFCCFVGLIIGAVWQAIGWVLYQGLRKSQV